MSKSAITKLFVAAVIAVVAGIVVAVSAGVAALANGAVTIGGPTVVTVDGHAFAGTLGWFVVGGLAIAGGSLAALASWIGALLNTVQLDDKTWFVALLVAGLVSIGWVATAAYILAGPDSTREHRAAGGIAPASVG